MEMSGLVFRTLFMYFVVFLIMRLMGKREIGKLSVFDLVISIMIAEIAVLTIEDDKIPLIEALVPLGTLVSLQLIIAWLALKNQTIRRWFDGSPSILVRHGKLDREEMKKQKYNLDDLLLQLRMKDVADLREVDFAILETNGILTVFKKKEAEQGEASASEGLPLPLVLDGKVQDDHLKQMGKNRDWLLERLSEYGISDFQDVFYCSIDSKGEMHVDKEIRA